MFVRRAVTALSGKCHATAELLSDYLEQELEGLRLRRIRRHLDRCGRCRSMVASLGRTIELLHELGSSDAHRAPSIADAVSRRVRSELGPTNGRRE